MGEASSLIQRSDPLPDGSAAYQLAGGVTAYQGDDG